MPGTGRMMAVAVGLCVAGAAHAQGLAGPLAPSDSPPTAAAVGAAPVKRSARRAKAAAPKRTAVPASARLPAEPRVPVPEPVAAGASGGTNPVSFGMKWNGSNDNAAQTRIENLNGQATGTGAEVGMKLHF